ncbi:MAG: hypothetical protein SPJ12_02760, partial [Duodenibacillus sp.]|nr:hypothetical protein [Duodenibacillus sp.]
QFVDKYDNAPLLKTIQVLLEMLKSGKPIFRRRRPTAHSSQCRSKKRKLDFGRDAVGTGERKVEHVPKEASN